MLIDEDNLDRTLQASAQSIQVSETIFRKMLSTDNSSMTPSSIVDMTLYTEPSTVVQDSLSKDGDSRLERDNEGNCDSIQKEDGKEDQEWSVSSSR